MSSSVLSIWFLSSHMEYGLEHLITSKYSVRDTIQNFLLHQTTILIIQWTILLTNLIKKQCAQKKSKKWNTPWRKLRYYLQDLFGFVDLGNGEWQKWIDFVKCKNLLATYLNFSFESICWSRFVFATLQIRISKSKQIL